MPAPELPFGADGGWNAEYGSGGRMWPEGGLSPKGVLRGVGRCDMLRSGLARISRAEVHHSDGSDLWPCWKVLQRSRRELLVAQHDPALPVMP